MTMSDYDDPWTIDESQKMRYAALFLLEYVINKPRLFKVWLERDDADLEPILEWMLVKGWIEIRQGDHYVPNEKGRQVLEVFIKRYAEFVYFFDVFSGVDLETGDFAFARYFDFENDSAWQEYLQREQFDDLRIAVAEYMDIDAVEIVFMQFVRESRFGKDATGWQFDLLLGTIWNSILEICNEAIDVSELGYECEDGFISGETVMHDIFAQGSQLLAELLNRANREMLGISQQGKAASPEGFVVQPVKFPPASHFDFDAYTKQESRGDLWNEIEKL